MDFAGALCSKQQVSILTFWLMHVNGGGRVESFMKLGVEELGVGELAGASAF